jgi:hypothetical protein
MTTFQIVSLFEEDDPTAEPVCEVEAPGKLAAMNGAAIGLGGSVEHSKTYQQNRPILWLDGGMYVARRRPSRRAIEEREMGWS